MGKRREAAQAYRAILAGAPEPPYYRMRAAERLGRLGKAVSPALAAAGTRPVRAGSGGGLHLLKARALRELALADEAVGEYGEHVRARPEERADLAECCEAFLALGRYDRAIWLGGRLLRPLFIQEPSTLPIPGYWQCVYPLGYWETVRQQAEAESLDPYLISALIREESSFAPRAVSRTGARGLMQLMPHTAQQVARAARLPYKGADGLEQPEINIRLGTRHVAELLQEHEGRVGLTLAAYNAGKQPVQRWLSRFGLRDEEEFIEDIPYSETRNYVKRVLGSHARYADIYGTESRGPSAEHREPGRSSRAPEPGK
jgi:soluble lytic murein transglycosylase